ncbi:probable protein STAY-GREEN, chloroplastic at N-terminal half [Coccomyxa sp. Obi]|nr:probable protein STAY-GREEN, chloroplastic at N-terminal half [Coccomyxa sp. Obi]
MSLQRCQGPVTSYLCISPLGVRTGLKRQTLAQPLDDRLASHAHSGPSERTASAFRTSCSRRQVTAQLLRPPVFDPRKLSTTFLPGSTESGPLPPAPRCYTLTHNDLTGQLRLSIGSTYNWAQVSGWYTRLIRDEVLAEWKFDSEGQASLHVHCHVSGEERWLAPPALRNYIFQREMPLVLDTLMHADQVLLRQPCLQNAAVVVHLTSHIKELHMSVQWGLLTQRSTWPINPVSLLQLALGSPGGPVGPASAPAVSLVNGAVPPLDGVVGTAADTRTLLVPSESLQLPVNGSSRSAEICSGSELPLVSPPPAGQLQPTSGVLESAAGEPLRSSRERNGENGAAAQPKAPNDDGQWLHRGKEAEASGVSETALMPAQVNVGCSQLLGIAVDECSNGSAEPLRQNRDVSAVYYVRSGIDTQREAAGFGEPKESEQGSASSSEQLARKGQCYYMSPLQQSELRFSCAASLPAKDGRPINVRGIVSEWLASGHEVVTVRL